MIAGLSSPAVFNRNQGAILAARGEVSRAIQEVPRVQYELTQRLAVAFGAFEAAEERVERYKKTILPAATKALDLSLTLFKGGQFEYLRVLQAQRAVQEAALEALRAQGDAWRAISEIAGLLQAEELP